jgi:hypothetical protein
MNRAAAKHRNRRHGNRPPDDRRGDAGVYVGLLMVGAMAVGLWYLLSPTTWTHGLIGYMLALAVLVNLYTWQVFRGRHLANWQKALARLPLRFAGFGTRGGKPLEAAHGQESARTMLLVSIAASVVIVGGLSLWLIR